jgi:hypothetical protein
MAGVKIADLPASTLPLTGTELVPVVQGGATKNAAVSSVWAGAVSSVSFGSTGLTPSTATTGAVTVAGTLAVANGGSGATTLTGVLKGNGTSAFTAGNVNLTSEVTGTLPVGNGGTGAATFTANNVLLGNGTSAFQVVAPGANGNVLTSNGTTWQSTALPGGGVASISFGSTGLTPNTATGGAVTVAGTLAAANGGTGLTTPGANGNVLTSNGTAWVSGAPATPAAAAQGFVTQATGANQPPGSFSPSDSFALI